MTGAGAGVVHVGVVVPVRDEEDLLPTCLAALATAVAVLREARPGVVAEVVVVLDGCRDGSARIARTTPWPAGLRRPAVLATPGRGVGAARAAGAAHVLRSGRAHAAGDRWLAMTDADSAVPARWLLEHVLAAESGWDARVGTVVLAPGPMTPDPMTPDLGAHTVSVASPAVARRWTERQTHREGHDHVHGANLGVRVSAYHRAGRLAPLVTGEDIALVAALDRCGAAVLRTARAPVTTSARYHGRAPAGVADDLLALAGE